MSHTFAEFTFDASIVSDLHKEAHGCRPSSFWWQCWNEATEEERQALVEFERDLASVMKTGNCDELTALSWMTPASFDEATPNSQDIEFWVWEAGILFTDRGRDIVKLIKQIYGVK
jgi:hypothetical protein